MNNAIKYLLRDVLDGARFVRLDTRRGVLYVWCGGTYCDFFDVLGDRFGCAIDTMNVEHCCPEDVEVAVDSAIAEGEHDEVITESRRAISFAGKVGA